MPSKSPQPLTTRPARRAPHRRGDVIHHEVHIEGKLTGFWGAVAAVVFLLLLGVVFLLGLATITVVLWIACGALLLAMVTAVFRALTGTSGARPPRD